MSRSSKLWIAFDALQRTPRAGTRRRFAWMVLTALALGLSAPPASHGQFRDSDWSAPPSGGVPLVLAHNGFGTLALPLGGSVVGLAVYDIVTAAESAQAVNARSESGFKSPETALGVSAAATVVPLVIGFSRYTAYSELLVVGGIVLGPSMGHIYAGRPGRGLLTAGLRAGLGYLAIIALFVG